MNTLLKYSFFFIFCGFTTIAVGQKDAEIVGTTESSLPAEDIYIDGIVKKELTVNNRVLPYDHVREADIGWERTVYRELDTREKMNIAFRHPSKPFFEILRELGENGDIVTFRDNAGFPDFSDLLSIEELEGKLYSVDTTTVIDLVSYEETIKITKSEVFYEDINRYRVKEVWFFDEEASRMKVRILGIAPIIDRIDPTTGIVKYPEVLFWIYYPTAREDLSKYRVFNEHNEVAPMTWAELFEKRYFSSYIYKVPNELDYRLTDFYNSEDPEQDGIDMLLESQQIENELFNFEHDLWTY